MNLTNFLFSMPGGIEWLLLILVGFLFTVCPVLTVVFYLQVKRLKRENKHLLEKLLAKL